VQLLGHIYRRYKQELEYLNRQISLGYLNIGYDTVRILSHTNLVYIGDGHLNDRRCLIAD
jgi:hypothetical protein